MTIVKYLKESGVCTTSELLALKREHPADYDALCKMAEEEMKHNGIAVDAPSLQSK